MIIAIVLGLLAVGLVGLALISGAGDVERAGQLAGAYDAARAAENSQVGRVLLSVSRPLSGLKAIHLDRETATYKTLRLKLSSAGGMYGGSVEVFISVQVAVILLGALALVAGLTLQVQGMQLGATALVAAALAAMPYNRVSTASKKRREEISHALPEFVELLLMPVSSGYGLLPALAFTSSRLEGVVASDVKLLLQVLTARAATEQQAFADAGERLGTLEAVTFFTTLYQSYAEGVSVTPMLRSQAEQLRISAFEATRAKLKKIPNTIAIMIGIHLMPFLLATVLLPTFIALGAMA